MKTYKYLGNIEGQMPGVGYVAKGKVIEAGTQAQVNKIEEILAADQKAKRPPTFEVYAGDVTAQDRASVPLQASGVYPVIEQSFEASTAERPRAAQPEAAVAVQASAPADAPVEPAEVAAQPATTEG